MTASAFPGTLENINSIAFDSHYSTTSSGDISSNNDVVIRISNLPVDMSGREFKLLFSFCRPVVQTDFHIPSHTGLVFLSDVEQAKEVQDSLCRRIPEISGSVVELMSPLSNDSPTSMGYGSMHISPRSSAFSPKKLGRLSGSSGKRTILGEDKDSISTILSSHESSIPEIEPEFFESVMNRRASSQPLYSTMNNGGNMNGLAALSSALPNPTATAAASNIGNGISSYPPPLASPEISNLATPIGSSTPTMQQYPPLNGAQSNPVSVRSTSPPNGLNNMASSTLSMVQSQPQLNYQRVMPPVNPADQNPPCNTLYVGNLPMNASEDELKALFSKQKGYKRLCFRTKANGPMCFVEFEDVPHATRALSDLYGRSLSNSVKGGIRLSFSKNPLGVRNNSSGSTISENDRRTSAPRQQQSFVPTQLMGSNDLSIGSQQAPGLPIPNQHYSTMKMPYA